MNCLDFCSMGSLLWSQRSFWYKMVSSNFSPSCALKSPASHFLSYAQYKSKTSSIKTNMGYSEKEGGKSQTTTVSTFENWYQERFLGKSRWPLENHVFQDFRGDVFSYIDYYFITILISVQSTWHWKTCSIKFVYRKHCT